MSEEISNRGRPSLYTEDIAREIIERLESGEPLVKICRDESMPGLRTVYDWERSIEGFSARVIISRAIGFDRIAADAMDIADEKDGDYTAGEDGEMHFNPEAVMRSKLRVDTRLKLLSKWDRKRYGEEKGDTTVNLNNQVNVVTITEERRRELIEKKRAANERLRAQKAKTIEGKTNP